MSEIGQRVEASHKRLEHTMCTAANSTATRDLRRNNELRRMVEIGRQMEAQLIAEAGRAAEREIAFRQVREWAANRAAVRDRLAKRGGL